jgi:hypothetical protein
MKLLRRLLLALLLVVVIAWFVVPEIVEKRMNRILRRPPYHTLNEGFLMG